MHFFLIFLLIIFAIWAVVMVIWILVAVLARFFSLVLVYWCVTFLITLLLGVVVGAILPTRVLTGRGKAEFHQITPDDLVEGTVIKTAPRSPNAEYGWDSAWPNYIPFQATEDARGVLNEAAQHILFFWHLFVSITPRGERGGEEETWPTRIFGYARRGVPMTLWGALAFPALFGYLAGVGLSTIAWIIVMAVLGFIVTLFQWVALRIHALLDVRGRRRLRASVKCPHCYGESHLPGYRCSNPECSVVHWTMLPGPLGLLSRRCSCGTQLPNTVSSAAEKLTPVCPYCREDLVSGSGIRQTVQIALIGSIGAGKTRLLDAMITELSRALQTVGGTISPLNPDAERYLEQAISRRQQAAPTAKTQHHQPVGLPFLVQKDKVSVELQVLDVAGEAFASWDETAKLRYLDTADGMVLVLDPLALPEIQEHLRRSRHANSILLATGNQEDAYGAAVDRLRAESVPLEKRGLAVALTKADVLTELSVASSIVPDDSGSIRQWLLDNDADLMVRRFDKDFRDVRYFLVDSMSVRDVRDPMNPWRVVDWLLNEAKSPLQLSQHMAAPAPTEATPEPSKASVT